ncbi:MAG: spore coat protein CotJB [Lachnospira pectinoschiza]
MQIKDKYCDYMTQYADYYGPLDKLHISNDNYWMWVATPMPWEMEGC